MLHPQHQLAAAVAYGARTCTPQRAAAVLDMLRPRWGADALQRFGLADRFGRWATLRRGPGWASWLMFPQYDAAGRLAWFQCRALGETTKQKRWTMPTATRGEAGRYGAAPDALFCGHLLDKHPQAWVVLCEGATDTLAALVWRAELSSWLSRDVVPVGTVGTTLTAEACARLAGRSVAICQDSDAAGVVGAAVAADALRPLAASVQRLENIPSGQDLGRFLETYGPALAQRLNEKKRVGRSMGNAANARKQYPNE